MIGQVFLFIPFFYLTVDSFASVTGNFLSEVAAGAGHRNDPVENVPLIGDSTKEVLVGNRVVPDTVPGLELVDKLLLGKSQTEIEWIKA